MNDPFLPAMEAVCKALDEPKPAKPPYPFCCHPEKCVNGRCERTVNGERWCCAD